MKRIPFVLLALLLSGVACSDDSEGPKKERESDPVTLTLSDPNATEETKALYSNLWAIQSKGFMFGHHDDLMYGRTWYGTEGGSDTKAVCGDYPAVYSFDFAEHIDDRHASDPSGRIFPETASRKVSIKNPAVSFRIPEIFHRFVIGRLRASRRIPRND